jgi:DNA repair protein RadC
MTKKVTLEDSDLRRRLAINYEHAVSAYELLALILNGDDDTDVGPIAHKLFNIFGGLDKIMSADLDKLRAVEGMTEIRVMRLRTSYFAALRMIDPEGRVSRQGGGLKTQH